MTSGPTTSGPLRSVDHIYHFDHPHEPAGDPDDLASLLGGKGAGLARMTSELGLPVPPGFTVALPVCQHYRRAGWPGDLDEAVRSAMTRLEERMGRRFGGPDDPLLVSVRSGAPVSMPGMLDTILDLGLNDENVHGLASASGDSHFAWDTYRRFLAMYSSIVLEIPGEPFPGFDDGHQASAAGPEQVAHLKRHIEDVAGRSVPEDPYEQLRAAMEAVFRSWDSDRARMYRATENLDEEMGTAVNIQAMVFGNRGTDSGTGVVFTRDPSTGRRTVYGDYLPNAQGEDIVAGAAVTLPVAELAEHCPAAHRDLTLVLERLEAHYRDMCDVEFTVEDGRLWLLQTRIAKRGAVAAVRCAVEMTSEPEIALTKAEAVSRVPAEIRRRARRETLAANTSEQAGHPELGLGLGASPGRATGRVVMTVEEAADADDDVILVRAETSPADVPGMAAAAGVLTTRGGLVSHAAVVARGWGIPAVVGASEIAIVPGGFTSVSGLMVRAGEHITIDGTSGRIWLGDVSGFSAEEPASVLLRCLPELAVLESWAADPT